MTCQLSVNVNAVAYLRNRRDLPWPSLIDIATLCLQSGAVGITVHPRPDERHIRQRDVFDIANLLDQQTYKNAEFNIEGYPDERFLTLCEQVKPTQITLVPDDPSQSTSDHGWNVGENASLLTDMRIAVHAMGARLSLFLDPDLHQVEAAKAVGTDRIELYTGPYGHTFAHQAKAEELAKLSKAASLASSLGLGVNAGHDLTLDNLPPLMAAAPSIAEVSIGHALTADALVMGYGQAVKRYRHACGQSITS